MKNKAIIGLYFIILIGSIGSIFKNDIEKLIISMNADSKPKEPSSSQVASIDPSFQYRLLKDTKTSEIICKTSSFTESGFIVESDFLFKTEDECLASEKSTELKKLNLAVYSQHLALELAKQKEEEKTRKAIKNLLHTKITVRTDKVDQMAWYSHKDLAYRNPINVYIGQHLGGNSTFLRMVLKYSGESWIFFETITFSIDGKNHEIEVKSYDKQTNVYDGVSESIDLLVDSENQQILLDIISSKETIIRLSGSHYRKDYTISSKQKDALRDILNYNHYEL